MTYDELEKHCKKRNFDQIVVVTGDIFKEIANLSRIMNAQPGDFRIVTDMTQPGLVSENVELAYEQRQASFFFQNTEICIVQPIDGETVYRQYFDRYGSCICCVRERIAASEFEAAVSRLKNKGIRIVQRLDNERVHAAWVDLTEELGILFELISDDSEMTVPMVVNESRIAQINITTPDVRETIQKLTDLLQIGPWEVGSQNKSTVINSGFLSDGELKDVEFEFLVAILLCGNIEWEAIQPVKGPLVYNDFLKRRGIGYHHILQEIPAQDWESVLEEYDGKRISLVSKGKVGTVDWCYMNTEQELGFYMELRTDTVMEQLPEGYLQYFWPQQEK